MQKNKTSIEDITDKLDETKLSDEPPKVKNRGIGAGGANTNKNGLSWEEQTCNKTNLKNKYGFIKKKFHKKNKSHFTLSKQFDNNLEIIYLTKHGFKTYINNEYGTDIRWEPDEAYLIKNNDKIIISAEIVNIHNLQPCLLNMGN